MTGPETPSPHRPRCPFAPTADGAPLIGNTLEFLRDTTGLLLRNFHEHGPVYSIRSLWLRFTVLLGFDAREFLLNGGEEHLTRHPVFDPVGEQLGSADFALAVSGEQHLQLRKLLQIAYSREVASRYVGQFVAAVREVVREWEPGGSRSVYEAVQLLAFQQYCSVMGNLSLREHYGDCRVVTDMNMRVGGRVLPLLMFRWPPYRAARKRVLGHVRKLVAAHRDGSAPARPSPDIIDTLLSLRSADGRGMSDDDMVCYALYGFAGGCSYMGRLVAFMMYEILRSPDLHRKLRTEADAVIAQGLRSAEDVGELRLLRGVYLETLRFHPVSQGLPYVSKTDFEFQGRTVRGGELVVLSQLPMLFSDPPFVEPHRFDPERCMPPRNEHRKLGAFNPFGMAHRTCAAMGLVELMTLTMVATLLHETELELSPADYKLRLVVNPLPAPDARFHMRTSPRTSPQPVREARATLDEDSCFASFPGADDDRVRDALARGRRCTFSAGTDIIVQGEVADAFYVIERGEATVLVAQDGGAPRQMAVLRAGDHFGEIGLLSNVPRSATVRTRTEVIVVELSGDDFRQMIAASDLVSSEVARVLRRRIAANELPALVRALGGEDLLARLPGFQTEQFPAGMTILREGEAPDRFYLLCDGIVAVTRDGAPLATLAIGAYFGETGLIHNAPRNATVSATSDITVASCDGPALIRLIREAGGKNDLALALTHRLR